MPINILPKPGAVKWIKGIAIFQIVFYALTGLLWIWIFQIAEPSSSIESMRTGVIEGTGYSLTDLTGSGGVGFIVGKIIGFLLAPVVTLLAVQHQNKNWSIAALVANGVTLINFFSIYAIVTLVLMLQKSSREYLKLSLPS